MAKKKKSSKFKGKKPENTSEQFLLGLMIGGGAAYVLSDETLRGQVIRYAGLTQRSCRPDTHANIRFDPKGTAASKTKHLRKSCVPGRYLSNQMGFCRDGNPAEG